MRLDCPVEDTDDRRRKTRTTEARDKRRGIPQGSPLSPLLANLYMRRFVLGWKMFGLERTLGAWLVPYVDDRAPLRREEEVLMSETDSKQPCCARDEGRLLGPGLQDQGSNHRKLRRQNGRGGESCGRKRREYPSGMRW
jgi:hypothetical protein